MQAIKKGMAVVVNIILWVVILVAALFTITTLVTKDEKKVSNFAGFTPLTVKSDSMVPTFQTGDLIIIKTCDPKKLKEGDIVTFYTIINNEFALNTHRITQIQEIGGMRSFVTKGDNNAIPDTHVIAEGDIVGRYVGAIPVLGKLMMFLKTGPGFFLVIVLPMFLFFIYQVYHLIMISISLKKATMMEEIEKKALEEEDMRLQLEKAREELEEARRLKEEALEKLSEVENREQ